MQNLTTLGEVLDRVDKMSRNCVDRIVEVADLSFDSLDTINIAGQKHPMRNIAQKFSPVKLRWRPPNFRAIWIALLPLMYPTTFDTAYFGGMLIHMCT